LSFIIISACNFDVTDIQNIELDNYSNNKDNAKLAEDLMYYDPRYIASKIPAFDEDSSTGIRFGYFIPSSGGNPSYKVTYSLKNSSVSNNIDALKKGFESFIPKLADFHVSKKPIFKMLNPEGESWLNSFFLEEGTTLLEESSELLKKAITPEKFSEIRATFKNEYGAPLNLSFVRAQYYEKFMDLPESVSLYYSVNFPTGKNLFIRVAMHQVNEKWVVMGFNMHPRKV